jgi:hypothetical protein
LLPAPVDFPEYANMRALWVMDGRLMYAACVRELGTAPAAMMTAAECAQLLNDPRGRYTRARYKVTATVPEDWRHVGLLPYAPEDSDVWEYPRQPGRTFTTWADAAEVDLAAEYGWRVVMREGIRFTKGRPLDTWATRLLRAYDRAETAEHARMVRAALRGMLLYSVGAWHSSGRTETTVTAGGMDRPAGDGWGAPQLTKAGAVWRRRVPLDGRAAAMAHPEFSTQIWGRARARVLSAPTAVRGVMAGALHVPFEQLVSIYGDAVMTTARPAWGAPEYDDGKPGRLRVKGYRAGPMPWPRTASQRDQLMHLAETTHKEGTN